MSEYEDFILQRFADKDGNLETNKPRECRLCWIKNDYPPFEELEKICNSTLKTIKKYSSLYNWKSIRKKATDLKAKADLELQQQKQKEKLENWDKVNEELLQDYQDQKTEIKKQLQNPELNEGQKAFLRKELRDINKEIRSLQPNSLRTVNLPDKLNDRQDHKHSGELELNVRLKKYLKPENITD